MSEFLMVIALWCGNLYVAPMYSTNADSINECRQKIINCVSPYVACAFGTSFCKQEDRLKIYNCITKTKIQPR